MQLPRPKLSKKILIVLSQSGLPLETVSLFQSISKELSIFREDAVTESLLVSGFNNTKAEHGAGRVFLQEITCLEAPSHLGERNSQKLIKATLSITVVYLSWKRHWGKRTRRDPCSKFLLQCPRLLERGDNFVCPDLCTSLICVCVCVSHTRVHL